MADTAHVMNGTAQILPIRTAAGVFGANGTYTFTLGPGVYLLEVWLVGTGVDVQIVPVTPLGTSMGTAYNCMLIPATGTGADPTSAAVSMTTGRRLRAVSMLGGTTTNALGTSDGYVAVANQIKVVLTNTSAVTELYLMAVRVK